ncbi:uncharacterized protein [Lepeophtheirus salmonis]|uniref:uncharacterized protein n=1 Tax=Lepeophtheirus salmonis TaxID=72036 RepID=UPI001AE6486A|nr:uncharacterized protein LOC121123770 [Lepeophtheirus salmonis]
MKLAYCLLFFIFTEVISADFKFDGSSGRPNRVKVKVGPNCNTTNIEELKILTCYCSDIKQLRLGHHTPHARKIFVRYLQTQSNGLAISNCEEVYLHSNLEWLVQNSNTHPVEYVSIEKVESLFPYEARVFDFTFQKNVSVDFRVDNIKNPVVFPTNVNNFPMFNGPIRSIHFNSISFLDFNTNGLFGVSYSEPNVTFSNCIIKTKDPGSESMKIKLSSLNIISSSIIGAGRGTFNVTVPKFKVSLSNLELISSKSFDIESLKTEFIDSSLGLQANSLRIKSRVINFINTTFDQPKTLSMIDLHPNSYNGPDILRFINVTLRDPSRGSLVTGGFSVVEYKDIFISNCLCNLHIYLLDTTISAFTLRMLPDLENLLQQDLKNNSLCYNKISQSFDRISDCDDDSSRFDIVYTSIIAVLFIGIIGIIATILVVYILNKRNRDQRIALIKDWSIALPKPKSYRETMVKFNLESVQTFSRPSSIAYAEQFNEPDIIQGLDKKGSIEK